MLTSIRILTSGQRADSVVVDETAETITDVRAVSSGQRAESSVERLAASEAAQDLITEVRVSSIGQRADYVAG